MTLTDEEVLEIIRLRRLLAFVTLGGGGRPRVIRCGVYPHGLIGLVGQDTLAALLLPLLRCCCVLRECERLVG